MEVLAIIDPRFPAEADKKLRASGFMTIPVPLTGLVDIPLAGHPDIQMFLHEKNLFVHPDIDIPFLKKLERYINIIQCKTRLTATYPGDIPYNIACTGDTAIHKRTATDKTIAEYLSGKGINIVNAKQGYAKCSTMIVNNNSIITSDITVKRATETASIDVLLISEGAINLPGYRHGFIGGASGRFLDTVYITGSLDHHPDRKAIYSFIESKGMKLTPLSGEIITDTGSIIFIG